MMFLDFFVEKSFLIILEKFPLRNLEVILFSKAGNIGRQARMVILSFAEM